MLKHSAKVTYQQKNKQTIIISRYKTLFMFHLSGFFKEIVQPKMKISLKCTPQ